ncbi:hypothetical protein ABI59_00585 [Acidobacteria bacterium Mor1]|nr:hypothetical protein ABI59_00585 [Acidobacteria bacterium Mor1]
MASLGRPSISKAGRVSAWSAIAGGTLLPLAETVRRSNHLLDPTRLHHWLDDYVLGALLIAAGWRVLRVPRSGTLIAAWGICVGALTLSFMAQLDAELRGSGDPGVVPSMWVLLAKGIFLASSISCLVLALRGLSDATRG